MLAEIVVPELGIDPGETILVSVWFAEEGDEVVEGDRVVELLVGGATFDATAPVAGRLAEKLAAEDDAVQVGQVLGLIEAAPGEEELPPIGGP